MLLSIELIPSSARATGSSAAPLPSQLAPLLENVLERVKGVLEKAMPVSKKRTALEEAEYEDEDDEGTLEREILMQSQYYLLLFISSILNFVRYDRDGNAARIQTKSRALRRGGDGPAVHWCSRFTSS